MKVKKKNKGETRAAYLFPKADVGLRSLHIGPSVSKDVYIGGETPLTSWCNMLFADTHEIIINAAAKIESWLTPALEAQTPIDIAKWVAANHLSLPGGIVAELPVLETGLAFHNSLWHLLQTAREILRLAEDENVVFIDVSGSFAENVFNKEDIVYRLRDKEELHLVDITVDASKKGGLLQITTNDLGLFTPTVAERLARTDKTKEGDAVLARLKTDIEARVKVEVKDSSEAVRDITRSFLSNNMKKPLTMLAAVSSLSTKIPGCTVVYSIMKVDRSAVWFARSKDPIRLRSIDAVDEKLLELSDLMTDTAWRFDRKAVVKRIAADIRSKEKKTHVKPEVSGLALDRIAKGGGSRTEIADALKALRANGYGELVEKMHECYRYVQATDPFTKGIPPPILENFRNKTAMRDLPHTLFKLLDFLAFSDECKPGVIYGSDCGEIVEITERVLPMGLTNIRVLRVFLWGKRSKAESKRGRFRDTLNTFQLGCVDDDGTPAWVRDIIGRSKVAKAATTPWTEYSRTDEDLARMIAADRNELQSWSQPGGANIPNDFQRAANLLEIENNAAGVPKVIMKDASRILDILGSTRAGEMACMGIMACEAAMNACKKYSRENTFHLTYRAGERIAFLTKVTAPLAAWRGTSIVAFVAKTDPSLSTTYAARWSQAGAFTHTKALIVTPAMIRNYSTIVGRVSAIFANTVANANTPQEVMPDSKRLSAAHLTLIAVNARRTFGVGIYAARWMGNITAGIGGDINAVADKVRYGNCVNRLEAFTIAESVILRHAATCLIRDKREKGSHLTTAIDGSKTLNISPPGVWGISLTFQGYISAWYTAEATHGVLTDPDLANAKVVYEALKIIQASQDEAARVKQSGIPVKYYDMIRYRKADLKEVLDDPEFMPACEDHAVDVAKDKSQFSWSFAMTHSVAASNPIPGEAWSQVKTTYTLATMQDVMTSKKACVMNTGKSASIGTDLAALAHTLPILNSGQVTYQASRAALADIGTRTRTAMSSGHALTAMLHSIYSLDGAVAMLCDKADSVEKMRILAVMNYVLRWAAFGIELSPKTLLNLAKTNTLGVDMPTSSLLKTNKSKVIRDLQQDAAAKMRRAISYNPANGLKEVPIMNDCSAWGPMKNLIAVYISNTATGMPTILRSLYRSAMHVFMSHTIATPGNTVKDGERIVAGMMAQRKLHRKGPVADAAGVVDKPRKIVLGHYADNYEVTDAKEDYYGMRSMEVLAESDEYPDVSSETDDEAVMDVVEGWVRYEDVMQG